MALYFWLAAITCFLLCFDHGRAQTRVVPPAPAALGNDGSELAYALAAHPTEPGTVFIAGGFSKTLSLPKSDGNPVTLMPSPEIVALWHAWMGPVTTSGQWPSGTAFIGTEPSGLPLTPVDNIYMQLGNTIQLAILSETI